MRINKPIFDRALAENRYSQQTLSDAIGLPLGTLKTYIYGTAPIPPDVLVDIATTLQLAAQSIVWPSDTRLMTLEITKGLGVTPDEYADFYRAEAAA